MCIMFMFFPTNICRGLATKHASIIENIGGIGRDKEMLKKGFFYGPRVSQFLQIPIAIGRDKEMLKKAFFTALECLNFYKIPIHIYYYLDTVCVGRKFD